MYFVLKAILLGFVSLRFVCGNGISLIVLSQSNKYHVNRAIEFRKHIEDQLQDLPGSSVAVYIAHEQWQTHSAWTVFPLVKHLVEELSQSSWIVLCEEETRVNVLKLQHALAEYDPSKAIYLGKGLRDASVVIIHHFRHSPPGFSYPDFSAGVAFSIPALKWLHERISIGGLDSINFSIDPKHELAWFLWDEGNGTALTNSDMFCTANVQDKCATNYTVTIPNCGESISENELFIAVKTCEKFHNERIPIIKQTWSSECSYIEYYSETVDASIPTVDLGVPNSELGHCAKTYAIMKRATEAAHIKHKHWLVIVDDDTLLSVRRLRQLLACYDSSNAVAIGERYGYKAHNIISHYDYITGGGGMVFSMETVRQIIACDSCKCYSNDQPDDMMIGIWLKRLGIPVTHSPLFHQARVDDYSKDFLQHQTPVSFHKFWNNDPHTDYKLYLQDPETHDEL